MDQHPLVKYREKAGLTQEQLAERLQVSRALVSLIESGARAVTPAHAKAWSQITGIPKSKLCPEIFGA
jgi:transcriptional regulator with XRE-family HTH domain